jgi:hypothetical protein
MNQVRFNDHIQFSIEHPMDESMLLGEYDAADDLTTRAKKLHDAAQKFESDTAFAVAARARVVTQIAIAQFIEKNVFASMKLNDNQTWLQLGVTTYITAKYTPRLTGVDAKQLLADLIYERPGSDPKADALDLLDLPDLGQLLPQYRQNWINAARRKSTLAIEDLVAQGGDDSIKKALAAVKKNPPKDGPSMVSLITGASGVNLLPDLKPKR